MLLQFAAASPRVLGAAEEIPLKEAGSWTHAGPSFGTAGADAAASRAEICGTQADRRGPGWRIDLRRRHEVSGEGGGDEFPSARPRAVQDGKQDEGEDIFRPRGSRMDRRWSLLLAVDGSKGRIRGIRRRLRGGTGDGLDEDYYEKIGDFISSDGPGGYNESVLIEARSLYYPDKAAMDAYYEENMIDGDLAWRWETDKSYHNFKDLFAGSDASRRRAVYAVFFILGLRVVSMVDALKMARDSNGEAGDETGMRLDMEPCVDGVRVSLCRRF